MEATFADITVNPGTFILAQARNATQDKPQGAHDYELYLQVEEDRKEFRFQHGNGGAITFSSWYRTEDIFAAYEISDAIRSEWLTYDEVKEIKKRAIKYLKGKKA